MTKPLIQGSIFIVNGGKYGGKGAKLCKFNHDKKTVEVIIEGKVVKLGFDRLPNHE